MKKKYSVLSEIMWSSNIYIISIALPDCQRSPFTLVKSRKRHFASQRKNRILTAEKGQLAPWAFSSKRDILSKKTCEKYDLLNFILVIAFCY